jgi:hypothetical protein
MNIKQLTFENWVLRNYLYRNPDCDECPNLPDLNTCKMENEECPRLKILLSQYRKTRLAEMKKEIQFREIEPRYTSSSDFDGADRGRKIGGLTESHLNEDS